MFVPTKYVLSFHDVWFFSWFDVNVLFQMSVHAHFHLNVYVQCHYLKFFFNQMSVCIFHFDFNFHFLIKEMLIPFPFQFCVFLFNFRCFSLDEECWFQCPFPFQLSFRFEFMTVDFLFHVHFSFHVSIKTIPGWFLCSCPYICPYFHFLFFHIFGCTCFVVWNKFLVGKYYGKNECKGEREGKFM